MPRLLRPLVVVALALALAPAWALADVVGPCPPMFDPSHGGCRFDPSRTELLVALGILAVAVASVVTLLVVAGREDKKAPRDP